MKKFFISFILLIISVVSYGQLTEDFENGTFSSEWTVYSTAGTATGWQIGKTDSISKQLGYKKLPADCGKYTAIAVCGGGAENVDSWLITPKVHITENQYLNFMMSAPNAYTMSHDTLDIMISTTTTAKEAFTQRIHRIIPRAAIPWGLSSIDLSNFAGQDIYIGFRDYHASRGSFMKESLFLDNISISASPSHDLALEAVLSPANSCNTSQNAKLVIQNNGANATSFEVGYKVDEQDAITETIHQMITGGTKETITLANPIVLSEGKKHTVVFWIKNTEPDTFITNDTVAASVKIGSELPFPYVMTKENAGTDFSAINSSVWSYKEDLSAWALTGKVTNLRGELMSNCIPLPGGKIMLSFQYAASHDMNLIINTGAPFLGSYSAVDTLQLPKTNGLFKQADILLSMPEETTSIGFSVQFPTATWQDYCEFVIHELMIDTAKRDLSAQAILEPAVNNLLSSEEGYTLKVAYRNSGGGDITGLKLSYRVDEGKTVTENIDRVISEGEVIEYAFTNKYILSADGSHRLTVWSILPDDAKVSNDTIVKDILVYSPLAFPFKETFADEKQNQKWSIINVNDDQIVWNFMEHPQAVKDGKLAYKNSISGIESKDYLISPAIKIPIGKARLSFYYATSAYNTGTGKLKVLMGTEPDPKKMNEVLFDQGLTNTGWLNGYSFLDIKEEGNYYFAFYGYGSSGDIYLDYLKIDAGEDLCIHAITFDETNGFNKDKSDVTISFINHGVSAQKDIPVSYYIEGKPISMETVEGPVAPGDTVQYIFKHKADISIPDSTYRLLGKIEKEIGEDTFNDAIIGQAITHWSNKTLPYEQGFETLEELSKWTTNSNTQPWGFMKSAFDAYEGTQYLFHQNEQATADDWMFSECIEIPTGTYDFSFFYRTMKNWDTAPYKQKFKVMLGEKATPEGMVQEITDYDSISVSGASYKKHSGKLKIEKDGKYYLGFYNYSQKGYGQTYIDNIELTSEETGTPLPYVADFINEGEEWTKYNPSQFFYKWELVNSGFDTYMYVNRDKTYNQPEGMLISPALKVEKSRKFKLTIDYAVTSAIDSVGMNVYCGTVNNPDSMTLLKHLPAVSELSRITDELQFPEDGNYYFGFKSNSTATYELKLARFAVEYTGASSMNKTRSELNVYKQDGKIRIIAGTDIKQVIITDISGKHVYNRSDIREKSFSIPISNSLSGIYILQISDENGNTVRKIKL